MVFQRKEKSLELIYLSLKEGSNDATEINRTVYSLHCSPVSPVSMTYKHDS